MKDMSKMFGKKKKESTLSDNEKNAKMSVLHDLRNQASSAMGEKVKGFKAKAATTVKPTGKGPGVESPMHGSALGEVTDADSVGSDHPTHGSVSGDHDASGVGESHPMHGSVAGESDGSGPGDESPMHGSVMGDHDASGPGDQDFASKYGHMSGADLDAHIAKLMAHRKSLKG
jgi:hypothetical protein